MAAKKFSKQERAERKQLLKALNETGWVNTEAARLIGTSEASVRRRIRKYGLVAPIAEKPEPTPDETIDRAVDNRRKVAEQRERDKAWKRMEERADITGRILDTIVPYMEAAKVPQVRKVQPKKLPKRPVTFVTPLNDLHWGKLVDKNTLNMLNEYGPNVAALRIQHWVDTVISWAASYEDMGHEVERIVLPLLGDIVNGELHPEDEDNYAPSIVQTIDCSLVLAQAIYEIAAALPHTQIDLIAPAGDNHTRLTKKSATSAKAFGTTLNTVLCTNIGILTGPLENVTLSMDVSHQTFFRVYDKTFGACHGNMLRGGGGQLGIPAYGMRRHHDGAIAETVVLAKRQVRDLRLTQNMTVDDRLKALYGAVEGIVDKSLVAHFHTHQKLEFTTGDLTVLPALMGPDPYARDALRKPASLARQLIMVQHPEHGDLSEHVVHLNHIMDESDTSSRYTWGAMGSSTFDPYGMMKSWREEQGL